MRDLIKYSEQEIDALTEGHETDVMVSRYVFGDVPVHNSRLGCFVTGYGAEQRAIPQYSSDIGAAWLVVEKLQISVIPQHRAGWKVDTRADTQIPFVEAYDFSAPLAICKAALKAALAMKLREASNA